VIEGFAACIAGTVVPFAFAIAAKVSPDLTIIVVGNFIDCPIVKLLTFVIVGFAFCNSAIVVPLAAAIADKVSPDFTTTVPDGVVYDAESPIGAFTGEAVIDVEFPVEVPVATKEVAVVYVAASPIGATMEVVVAALGKTDVGLTAGVVGGNVVGLTGVAVGIGGGNGVGVATGAAVGVGVVVDAGVS
jgi:hypothetical protein